MSALDRPSEVVLVALFDAADKAEAAARAFLHGGQTADRVALLARATRVAAFQAVPHMAHVQLPGLGWVVACGALAVELGDDSTGGGGEDRLGVALRRLGLSVTEVPRLARAVRAGLILMLAPVPREEAPGWGRMLGGAGPTSLTARARLGRWPSTPAAPRSPARRSVGPTGAVEPSRHSSNGGRGPGRRRRRMPASWVERIRPVGRAAPCRSAWPPRGGRSAR